MILLQPVVRRTWAPRGQTPVHYSWARHDRLSVISGLTISPRRRCLGLRFRIYNDNLRPPEVMTFLSALRRELGTDLTVILDRLNAHRTAARKLGEQCPSGFRFEWLPPYAPDLNPVEQIWEHAKYVDMANFIPDDIAHLERTTRRSLRNTASHQHLLPSFVQHANLSL
jgi:transposase